MSTRVSLAELATSEIRLRPAEAVAIVSAICDQHIAGTLPGIPSVGVIRLTRQGDVVVEGPITTGQDDVARAALLLTDLLSGFDALPEYRASGALRLVIARALGTIDFPPYRSLAEFRSALARFSDDDVRDVAQGLFTAWERARAARAFNAAHQADLTISDVRRARRATGLSLGYLAAVAGVPPTRLRDLEWGYMRDWPATADGRAQVIRYARAAGLDESTVLSIAWPMILDGTRTAGEATPGVALVRSGPQTITVMPRQVAPVRARSRRAAIVAAAATVALIAAFAFGWRSSQPAPPRPEAVQVDLSDGPRALVTPAVLVQDAEPRSIVQLQEPSEGRPAPHPAAAPKAKPKPKPQPQSRRLAPPPQREEPHKKPFFERELFRIVIR